MLKSNLPKHYYKCQCGYIWRHGDSCHASLKNHTCVVYNTELPGDWEFYDFPTEAEIK